MKCFGMLMDGRAQTTGIRQRGREATLLLVINGHSDLVKFILPEAAHGSSWSLLVDTNDPEKIMEGAFKPGDEYGVTGRSLLLFALNPDREKQG
jgi:glycogen operon protein